MVFVLRAGCAALLAIVLPGCAFHTTAARAPYTDVPRTTITAVELRKTSCFGRCPEFTVRFSGDGSARYAGGAYAPRAGTFVGRVDFERLAAWIDSQQPETLADEYATNWVDSPHVSVVVERGAHRKVVTTAHEGDTPVRFEGIVLALDGLTGRLRWLPIDDLTPYVGDFARGRAVLHVIPDSRLMLYVYGSPSSFWCSSNEYLKTERMRRGGLHLVCGARSSVVRAVPGGLRAEGCVVAPGFYERVTAREADRRAGLVPAPAPS
jgi:hypothetical protein